MNPSASPQAAIGTVARLRAKIEARDGAGYDGGCGGRSGAASPGSAQQRRKRAKLGTWEGFPDVPSPNDADATDKTGKSAEGPAGRQLWSETEEAGAGADAAKAARLEQIRAKFGTKVFLPAKELPPAELRQQLDAAEVDLDTEDYQLRRWEPMPVLLQLTSNAHCKNFVLKGLSGCVGLASSLTHVWVLGAGQTIWIAEADGVEAEQRENEGVFLRFGDGDFLTLRADAAVAADIVAWVRRRAAKRVELRSKSGAAATGAAAASHPAADAPAKCASPGACSG